MKLGERTKIVCTIGPVADKHDCLGQLVTAGMDVMRLNFSHGTLSEHQSRVDAIREIMIRTGKTVAIMQDLCGPKMRIGGFKNGSIILKEGDVFTLVADHKNHGPDNSGDEKHVSINYKSLPKEVKKGTHILLDDGTKKLQVLEVKGKEIITKVMVGGPLSSDQGLNVPGADLSIYSLTTKDRKDLEFGLKNKVDFIALSFVRKVDDINDLREILIKHKSNAKIIAKIETPEAVKNFDSILEATDGVMVARGDLAIEIGIEKVPLAQKMIIHKCNAVGKPVIVATQMLESMVKNPTPTRAEVSDIANAVIDGTDAVMLSEETAAGIHPVEAVKVMARVAREVEGEVYKSDTIAQHINSGDLTDMIAQSAIRTAHSAGAKFIVVLTRSGKTAQMIARYRPIEPILVMTDISESLASPILTFGCYPIVVSSLHKKNTAEIMKIVREVIIEDKIAKKGDKIVIVSGTPFAKSKNQEDSIMVETL
jgi:pyruvate kinase